MNPIAQSNEQLQRRIEALEKLVDELCEHQHQQFTPYPEAMMAHTTTKPVGFGSKGIT